MDRRASDDIRRSISIIDFRPLPENVNCRDAQVPLGSARGCNLGILYRHKECYTPCKKSIGSMADISFLFNGVRHNIGQRAKAAL